MNNRLFFSIYKARKIYKRLAETRQLWAAVSKLMPPQPPVHNQQEDLDCWLREHTVSHDRL